MSVPAVKSASTLGQSTGVGAGSGAAAGALVTLFSKDPSLRDLFKNVLIGGASGAVIGGGAHTLGNAGGTKAAPSEAASAALLPPSPAPAAPKKMNLGIAALSGLTPLGAAPLTAAAYGGISQGPGQAIGSGAAALAPPMVVGLIQHLRKAKNPVTRASTAVGLLGSSLGAMGAAHAGNKMREN